ncbi:MAG: class I SAM-dependent methyltransferase [Gallionellaceae bacterium]|nr:class I SAM-dependent methyltransferase [Gallionellaceae bacterium]
MNRQLGDAGANPATFDAGNYQNWRTSELVGQFTKNFDDQALTGKDVLDFGCGEGDLSFYVANLPVKSITGIDVDHDRVRSATARAEQLPLAMKPRFIPASNFHSIDMADASVDVLLCFDVLEHIMDYPSIIQDWKRVLRPGGEVMIWWMPWFHPYGHHIESLVPLPWAHVFFSDRTLIKTCARIYDLPEFKPRVWDIDEAGRKKPNKWLAMTELPEVNRLSMAEFEALCDKVGLRVMERRIRGFGGGALARFTHLFTRIPGLREFFSSSVVYRLRHA